MKNGLPVTAAAVTSTTVKASTAAPWKPAAA